MWALIAIIVGVLAGVIWELKATAQKVGGDSLFPSIIIPYKGRKIHLHHWTTYVLIEIFVSYWAINFSYWQNPFVLLIFFFFLTATVTNFVKFRDWKTLVYK
jgi:hypothetical protein